MSKVIGFVFLLAVTGSALAGGYHSPPFFPYFPVKAPEIDPASAVAALTMLAGTLAVIRGRRVKTKSDKSE